MGTKEGLAGLCRGFILQDWDTVGIQPHTMPNAIGMWYEEMDYFLYLLDKCDRNKNWVEIGAFCGGSACLMSFAKEHWADRGTGKIISVDLDFKPMFDINVKRLPHPEMHVKMEINSSDFGDHYMADNLIDAGHVREKDQISFAFIDGFHSYEQVLTDFNEILPFLSDDAIVAFHDVSPDIFSDTHKTLCKSYIVGKEAGDFDDEPEENFRLDEAIVKILHDNSDFGLLVRDKRFDCQHFEETQLTEWVRGRTSPFNAVAAIRRIM